MPLYIWLDPGLPYIYLIYLWYSSRFTEEMKRREKAVTLAERIAENNAERVRGCTGWIHWWR